MLQHVTGLPYFFKVHVISLYIYHILVRELKSLMLHSTANKNKINQSVH